MRKFLPKISFVIVLMVTIGLFAVPHLAHAADSPSCSLGDIVCYLFGTADVLNGIIARIFWWFLIPLASQVWSLIGLVIDEAVRYTLSSAFYSDNAISLAWSVIRDISNMFFIFILIYEGIRTILNLGNLVSVRKTITGVIIAALFLNFSLFFTKVIIDVSNVTAVWFMQGIINIGGDKSLSHSIGGVLGIQKMFSAPEAGITNASVWTSSALTKGALTFILVCVAIYVFFNIIFLLIGRTVSFIFLLITAPIGFVGPLVPMLKEYADSWWKELSDNAMMLPIFFLMIYLTLYIVDGVKTLLQATGSDFGPVNYVIYLIIIMMLLKSLKAAEKYSGEVGKMIGGGVKAATMFVGGAGLIGTVGRAATALRSSEALQAAATKGGFGGAAARGVLVSSNAAANASFGTKSAYAATLKAGGLDKTGLKDQFKGTDKSFSGKMEQEIKDEEAFAKLLGKGKTGAENRQTYATNLGNSLWSRTAGRIYGSREGDVGAGKKIGDAAKNEVKKEEAKEAKKKKEVAKADMRAADAEIAEIDKQIAAATQSLGPESDKTKQEAIKDNIAALQQKQKDIRSKKETKTQEIKDLDEAIEAGKEVEQSERDAKLAALDGKLDKPPGGDKPKEEAGPKEK